MVSWCLDSMPEVSIALHHFTPWLPVCFQPKTSSLRVFLYGNIFANHCAKELFKCSEDSASLCVCSEKKFGWEVQKNFFCY